MVHTGAALTLFVLHPNWYTEMEHGWQKKDVNVSAIFLESLTPKKDVTVKIVVVKIQQSQIVRKVYEK